MTVQCTKQSTEQLKSIVIVDRSSSNTVLLQSLTLCWPFPGNFMNLFVRAVSVNTRASASLCGKSLYVSFSTSVGIICKYKNKL